MMSKADKMKASMASLQTLQDRIEAHPHEKGIVSTAEHYAVWCKDRGHLKPFPVQFIYLGCYIVDKVRALKNSAKSVRRWISQLKTFSLMHQYEWLNQAEDRRMQNVIKELEFLDQNPTNRMLPLTKDINVNILNNSHISPTIKTCVTIGREGLLRGGEVCQLLRKHFIWSQQRDRVTIHLERSKANRKGAGEYVTLKRHGPTSGAAILAKHFDQFNLWRADPDAIVLPSYSQRKGLDWSKTISIQQLRKAIRDSLRIIGINGDQYGAHSLRAGGATDLFRAGVYYPIIKKFGRWKSDTALLYFRDQEQTIDTVMGAFAN